MGLREETFGPGEWVGAVVLTPGHRNCSKGGGARSWKGAARGKQDRQPLECDPRTSLWEKSPVKSLQLLHLCTQRSNVPKPGSLWATVSQRQSTTQALKPAQLAQHWTPHVKRESLLWGFLSG